MPNMQNHNRIFVALAAGFVGLLILGMAVSYADRVITLALNTSSVESPAAETGSFSLGESVRLGSASLAVQFGDSVKSIFNRVFSSRVIPVYPDSTNK